MFIVPFGVLIEREFHLTVFSLSSPEAPNMPHKAENAIGLSWMAVVLAVQGQKALLPVPQDEPAGVTNYDEQVLFALPKKSPSSGVICPSPNNHFQWEARGVDAQIARILAAHTGNLCSGCFILEESDQSHIFHYDRVQPVDFLANGTAHLYMEAFYLIPDLVDQVFRLPVDFLYPHYFDDFCLAVRSTGPVTFRFHRSFSLGVWIVTGIFLFLFAAILKFVLQATCGQAVLEAAQVFLSGSFSSRRPRHMMVWGTLLSVVMLNSFSGVFTGFLVVPKLGPELDTLSDVVNNVLVVYNREGGEFDLEILFASVDNDALRLYDLTTPGINWDEVRSGHAAILDTKTVLERNRRATLYHYGIQLHIAQQCIWTPAYKMFLVRGDWPPSNRYSSLLQRLVEGGIVRWLHDAAGRDSSYQLKLPPWDEPRRLADPPSLSVPQLADAFKALAGGLVAAASCLLAEVFRRPQGLRIFIAKAIGRCCVRLRGWGLADFE